MKRFLLGATAAVALLAGVNSASAQDAIGFRVFDNGVLIGSTPVTPGGLITSTFSDATFSAISITATGTPILSPGDFGVLTTSVTTNAGFTGTHTLTILATQVGEPSAGLTGEFDSALTANILTGGAGITGIQMRNFVDAADAGFATTTQIAQFLTPGGVLGSFASGPLVGNGNPLGVLFSETSVLTAMFTDGGTGPLNLSTTSQVTAAVPEPTTWAMLLLGFAGLGFMFHKRRKGAALPATA